MKHDNDNHDQFSNATYIPEPHSVKEFVEFGAYDAVDWEDESGFMFAHDLALEDA